MTITVHYKRRHNNATTTPTAVTKHQRWPCTRTNGRRQATLATLHAYTPGHRAYQWVRVTSRTSVP